MSAPEYFGTYARFEAPSKKDAAVLLGADNLVGDIFEIEFITEEGNSVAWIKNRFGGLVGFFDAETNRELSLYRARGLTMKAILSFVAYSEIPAPGVYWGEAAVLCYDNREEVFEKFLTTLAGRIAEGVRPEVTLGDQGIQKVLETNGSWTPTKLVPLPKKKSGTAFLKTHRSMSERLIEQGRKGNKGCYLISWIILLGAVAGIIFGLRSCGVF